MIEKLPAGTPELEAFRLRNRNGFEAEILNYGATLRALRMPDHAGQYADVVLGFDQPAAYLAPHPYFGSLVGRYANRIRAGRFCLGGTAYRLATNSAPHHLHGGPGGFHHVFWQARVRAEAPAPQLQLSYQSPDGEEGYPGALAVTVTYTLSEANELRIDYVAQSDRETIINLTSHAYFNLAGSGTISEHSLQIKAASFLPTDETGLPRGDRQAVDNTPFDFRHSALIGPRLAADDPQLRQVGGFDHCFVLDKAAHELASVALLTDPLSGRMLEVLTTQPGLQLYTANLLDGSIVGKGGAVYTQHSAVCLEAQHFPDSPNQPHFPDTTLQPGEYYRQSVVYRLGLTPYTNSL
jgi:aldose 1-epimerase